MKNGPSKIPYFAVILKGNIVLIYVQYHKTHKYDLLVFMYRMSEEVPRLPIIREIENLKHFADLLKENPGQLLIKFGAEWCGPCKKIESSVKTWFEHMPATVQCAIIDIDESFEVYAFLKNKKMVNGIPVILCYYKGNINYIPNDSVVGADPRQIELFFTRCLSRI